MEFQSPNVSHKSFSSPKMFAGDTSFRSFGERGWGQQKNPALQYYPYSGHFCEFLVMIFKHFY